MKGTVIIRGMNVDLRDTSIAKISDIEEMRGHLLAQDHALATQSTKDDVELILHLLNDIYAKLCEPPMYRRVLSWCQRLMRRIFRTK